MRRGVDSNVLVYTHIPSFEEHPTVRAFLVDQLARSNVVLAFTPAVLHEFVHVVTDGRRFEPPVATSEALAVARMYLGRTNTECLTTDELVVLDAFDLLERHNLGRKRIADTLLAATLLHHGIGELITCNVGDFGVFDGLNVIDPR